MPKKIDLTGQVFGFLTVLKESEKKEKEKEIYWECQCQCGKITRVRGSLLRKGKVKSCGCLNAKAISEKRTINLVGQQFNRLTVIERVENRNKIVYWKCKCSCGNIVEVSSWNLRSGHTQSCGCLQKENTSKESVIDIAGKRFGNLLVLRQGESKNGKAYWICQCDCGKIKEIAGIYLRNGNVKSCGCLISSGEKYIEETLNKLEIKYEKQKFYKGLIGVGGGLLRFDFYLPDYNLLIEYQGKQHYTQYYRFGGEEEYNKRIEHDRRKREYCKENNIDLLEIPYWKYNQIEEIFNKIKQEENNENSN